MKIYLPDIHIRQSVVQKDGKTIRNVPPILRFIDDLYIHKYYLTGDKKADEYIKLKRNNDIHLADDSVLKTWCVDDDSSSESAIVTMDRTGKMVVSRTLDGIFSASEGISGYDELKIALAKQRVLSSSEFFSDEWYWKWESVSDVSGEPILNRELISKVFHDNSILDLNETYQSTYITTDYMFMDAVYCNTDNCDPADRILIGFPESKHPNEPVIILHNVVACDTCGYGNDYVEIIIRTNTIKE